MKKLVSFILFLLICNITSFAQNGWSKAVIPGDELLNRSEDTLYRYVSKNGDEFGYFTVSNRIYANSKHGIFNYDKYDKLFFRIGYYDLNKKLLSSTNLWFKVITSNPSDAYYEIESDDDKKFISFLENSNGYIRIIDDIYGQGFYDITMPCFQNKECYKREKSISKYNKPTRKYNRPRKRR